MVPHSSKCDAPLLGAQCAVDSEELSDVVFVVCGAGGERWRVPAHRRVLADASPVFAAMLHGPLAEPCGREVEVRGVDRRAFDTLLRHVYGEKVDFKSVDTALATLRAAHRYQCEDLEHQCIIFLSSHIETNTVLFILSWARIYYNQLVSLKTTPTAPTLDIIEFAETSCLLETCFVDVKSDSSQDTSKTANSTLHSTRSKSSTKVPLPQAISQSETSKCDISKEYKLLINHCLQFIDLNADKVLQQEEIDELSEDDLLSIVQRDTLCLSSEVVLFKVLEQWSKSACKRKCMELSPENLRQELGNKLLFSVRFLLMNSEQFMNSPMSSKLLSSDECNILLGHILNHSKIPHSGILEELLPGLSKPRQNPSTKCKISKHSISYSLPVYKSSIIHSVPAKTSLVNSKSKKPHKKKKVQSRKENGESQERKPNMSDYFFSCIACIFD